MDKITEKKKNKNFQEPAPPKRNSKYENEKMRYVKRSERSAHIQQLKKELDNVIQNGINICNHHLSKAIRMHEAITVNRYFILYITLFIIFHMRIEN